MSRETKPKQFFNLITSQTLIEETVDRLKTFLKDEDIFFSTVAEFVPHLKTIYPNLKVSRLIVEPERRDTGPAMAYGAAVLAGQFPHESLGFFPADHFIEDREGFARCVQLADRLVQKTGKMLDISVTPNFASTNLGYTQVGDLYQEIEGLTVYRFIKHFEKPSAEQANQYLLDGNFLWHASYYMWTPTKFLDIFKETAPDVYPLLLQIQQAIVQNDKETIARLYQKLPKISIDYLVMEKIDPAQVLIIKGEFGWSDIGGWDVLFDRLRKRTDQAGNLVKGQCLLIDSNQNLIYGQDNKVIAAIGLNNMIVVDTGDALLICPQGKAALVKKIVEEMRTAGQDAFI